MMGLEVLLHKFTGGNDALVMLSAFSLLVLLNFTASMWVEIKNNDLKWNDLHTFVRPLLLNAMFLLGIEAIMIPAARVPLAHELFKSIQFLGWLSVMAIYFWGFYKTLKMLGLKTDKRVDEAVNKLNELNNKEDEQ